MATCLQCALSKKKKILVSEQYCDVCGFGFLMEPENKGRTCRDPNRINRGLVPAVREREEQTPEDFDALEQMEKNTELPKPVIEAEQKLPSSVQERVFQAIKDHTLIGKKDIMELAQVSEGEYTDAKDALLAAHRIIQEGERRGAKYRSA